MQRAFEALSSSVRRQILADGFVQEARPVSRPLKRESAALPRPPGGTKA